MFALHFTFCFHVDSYRLILYKWVNGYMVCIVQMGHNIFNQFPVDRQLVTSILFFNEQYVCRHPFTYYLLCTHVVISEESIPGRMFTGAEYIDI